MGSLVFRSQDAPQYRPGMYTCLGTSVGVVVLVVGMTGRLYLGNRRIRMAELVGEGRGEGYADGGREGDGVGWRYTY